jgi:hypothetical protein
MFSAISPCRLWCYTGARHADDKGYIFGTGSSQRANPSALANTPKADLMGIDVVPVVPLFATLKCVWTQT